MSTWSGWRSSNPEYNRDRRAKRMAVIREHKDVPCADCGQRYPHFVMDFDHVRGEKSFGLGDGGKGRDMGLQKVLEEIDKCDVVCANCHRYRTFSSTKDR